MRARRPRVSCRPIRGRARTRGSAGPRRPMQAPHRARGRSAGDPRRDPNAAGWSGVPRVRRLVSCSTRSMRPPLATSRRIRARRGRRNPNSESRWFDAARCAALAGAVADDASAAPGETSAHAGGAWLARGCAGVAGSRGDARVGCARIQAPHSHATRRLESRSRALRVRDAPRLERLPRTNAHSGAHCGATRTRCRSARDVDDGLSRRAPRVGTTAIGQVSTGHAQ
jgi:hypothetical protein